MSVVRLEEIYYGLAGGTKPATASDGAIYIARDTGGMWQRQDGAWWGLNLSNYTIFQPQKTD